MSVIPLVQWHSGIRIYPACLLSIPGHSADLPGGLSPNGSALQLVTHAQTLKTDLSLLFHASKISVLLNDKKATHPRTLNCWPSLQHSTGSTAATISYSMCLPFATIRLLLLASSAVLTLCALHISIFPSLTNTTHSNGLPTYNLPLAVTSSRLDTLSCIFLSASNTRLSSPFSLRA